MENDEQIKLDESDKDWSMQERLETVYNKVLKLSNDVDDIYIFDVLAYLRYIRDGIGK